MRRFIGIISAFVLTAVILVGCSSADNQETSERKVLKVGATPVPHAQLLELVKPVLEEKGIDLEIVEFTDYVKPNLALDDGEIDANFFQHVPYLESFNADRGLDLISVGTVHVEPLGAYSEKVKTIDDLEAGAEVAIPSDSVNGGRALILLESNGLIKLKEDAGLEATEFDIVDNPLELNFTSIEAAQLPRVIGDVDLAVINGNFAIEAGLNPLEDALVLEGSDSPYANIITVKSDYTKVDEVSELLNALQSDEIREYIEKNYNGGVVAAFSKN